MNKILTILIHLQHFKLHNYLFAVILSAAKELTLNWHAEDEKILIYFTALKKTSFLRA